MKEFFTNFFSSKRNILNLIALIVMVVQYLADTQWIPVDVGALIIFVLNMILGTWFPSGRARK